MDPLRPNAPTPIAPTATPADLRAGLVAALAQALPDIPAPAQGTPTEAVATARADAAGRQATLAPVLADLARALDAPALPPGLKAAIARVLARQLPSDPPPTAQALRAAVAHSGLFLEANLAAGREAPLDLKAALLVLQQALTPEAARPTPRRPAGPGVAPPTREGALAGQPPARATLDPEAPVSELAHRLRGEVDQVLARLTLHQLASLPDGPGARWMFELPLATPQGAAVGQFAIDQDEPRQGEPGDPAVWRTRFSLDLPQLGPVHVQLRMDGDRTAVTIWAETPEGLARLSEHGGELVAELGADVAFRPGSPTGAAAAPGRLLDRRS